MNKVYVKSDRAIKEFEQGNRSLSLKHRQLLIMVDGRRSDVEIAKVFNSNSVVEMLVDLEKLGYVVNANTPHQVKSHNDGYNKNQTEVQLSQDHLVFIKTFLIEEAQLQLGLMSRDIEQKIAMVQNTKELKSAIPRWHMAIRDSRNGRTVADKLIERLAHLMANPPAASASIQAS